MDDEQISLEETLRERMQELPAVVQEAIRSADVEKRLRTLSDAHKLHVDQWQTLENQVMLALLGFLPVEELEENIVSEIGVSKETAMILAADISRIVFEPIRQELERQLEHPEAKNDEATDIDAVRTQILSENASDAATVTTETPQATPIPGISAEIKAPVMKTPLPATPPPPPPSQKAERGPSSGAYVPGEASSTRKSVIDDPYREPPK